MSGRDVRARTTNSSAIWMVLLGAALVVLSFRFLDWYDVPEKATDSSAKVDFSALHSSTDQLGGAGVALAYFDWLGWAALIAVMVLGIWAALPSPLAGGLRVAGFLAGLIGLVGTYYALLQHFHATGSTRSVFDNSTWGMWCALAGFFAAAVGAVLGPRGDR